MTAFSRETGMALAVSTVMSERLQAPLQNVRLPVHEVISLWDIAKAPHRASISPLPEDVQCHLPRITKDGKQAVITKMDGTVELWSLKDGKRRMLQPRCPHRRALPRLVRGRLTRSPSAARSVLSKRAARASAMSGICERRKSLPAVRPQKSHHQLDRHRSRRANRRRREQ
jgi:hypothetical protein